MLKEEITLEELCAEIHLLCITLNYHFHKTKNYICQVTTQTVQWQNLK